MNLYKKLFAYVPERKHWAYISMFLAALAVCVLMGGFYNLWRVFEAILVQQDLEAAIGYGFNYVWLMIGRGILLIVGIMCSHYLGFRLETNLRKTGLYELMEASFAFFDQNASGVVRKTIDDNAANTHSTVAHLIPDNVTALLTPILMYALAFYLDWRMGILLIITTVIGFFQYMGMYSDPDMMTNMAKSLEEMSAATIEYIRGMQVIKIFGVNVRYYKTLIDSIINYKDFVYGISLNSRLPYVSFQVLFNLYFTLGIPFGIIFISRGEPALFILAKIIFFTVFSNLLFSSFMGVMFTANDNFQANDAVSKLEGLMEEMNQDKVTFNQLDRMESYDIDFQSVNFGYGESKVFEDFNLKLESGRVYALVGPSGGGKSTLAKLVSGFYPVQGGQLLIGGHEISQYSEATILSNIAFVFQHAKLFKTSIYDNVKIGNPQASHEEIMKTLELAQCNEILDKFEDREQTIIGSKGVHLSGGETQRIAIARAILKNANIIILDEASAATDPENEFELQQAFSNLMKDKTVIMIAHRLSSIRNVDEILFVEDGQVKERGSHEDLMALNGRYRTFQDLYEQTNEWRIQ